MLNSIKLSQGNHTCEFLTFTCFYLQSFQILHLRHVHKYKIHVNVCFAPCIKVYSPHRISLSSTVVYGFTYAFSQGVLFFGYVIAFRFGALLVSLPPDHILYSPFNDIFVVFLALVFGAMTAGQAGAFAPNYAKARLSANRIFALLNRVPATTVYFSEEGAKPVCSLDYMSMMLPSHAHNIHRIN